MAEADPRIYRRRDVVAFRKTNEPFGGLSNMAPRFPIEILDVRIATAEALYQACRFPHMPEIQRLVIAQTSPMTAKMRSKPYRGDSRPDWDAVRVPIMKWCLRIKLIQNWSSFGDLLLKTGDRPIVEDSSKDDFWGAMPNDEGILRGRNVLGRLLMELREKLRNEPSSLETVAPVPIPDFVLFHHHIPSISRPSDNQLSTVVEADPAPSLPFILPDAQAQQTREAPPESAHPYTPEVESPPQFRLPTPHGQMHRTWMVWLSAGTILAAAAIYFFVW